MQMSADAPVQEKTSASSHFTGMINYMINVPSSKNRNSCFQFFDVQQETLQGSSETLVSTASTIEILLNRYDVNLCEKSDSSSEIEYL